MKSTLLIPALFALALAGRPAVAGSGIGMYPVGAMYPLAAAPGSILAVPLLGVGGGMYPAVELVPNLLSLRHMNLTGNPYLGGPFAANPWMQQVFSRGLGATTPAGLWGAQPSAWTAAYRPVPVRTRPLRSAPFQAPILTAAVPVWSLR